MPKLPIARRRSLLPILFASSLLLRPADEALADVHWNASTGDWFINTNWTSQTLPTSSIDTYIDNGGTVTVSTAGAQAQGLFVGEPGGSGTLVISGSGTLSSLYAKIGISGLGMGTGSVTVDGGNWNDNTGILAVGFGAYGSLTITNNGTVTSGSATIAQGTGSTGTVTMNSGTWNANQGGTFSQIGAGGTATMYLNGGTFSTYDAAVGGSSSGTMIINGGTWNSSYRIYVGGYNYFGVDHNADGTMTVTNGTAGDYDGYVGDGGIGIVTIGNGGKWANSDALFVGNRSSGTLTIKGSGIVSVTSSAGQVTIGNLSGSQGTLQIGDNDAFTGSLSVKTITGGAGTAKVVFAQTNAFSLSASLTGSVSVQQTGAGTTTLSATANANTYTGGTVISGGKLLVNSLGGTGSGAVEVQSGGAIGGTGSITGALTIDGGGLLAPGSTTFTASTISLLDNAKLAFTLGTVSDKVTDAAGLSLGQNITLSLTTGTGFGLGTYSLINYAGTLVDNSNNFSGWTVVGLPGNFTASFQLSGSSVQLKIANIPEPTSSTVLALGLAICVSRWRRRSGSRGH
jgi:fibronectin-binding autotransporter adhesin